ncbi:hypothetical protein AVEN_129177-1, partial [Araneus ventricosus]
MNDLLNVPQEKREPAYLFGNFSSTYPSGVIESAGVSSVHLLMRCGSLEGDAGS